MGLCPAGSVWPAVVWPMPFPTPRIPPRLRGNGETGNKSVKVLFGLPLVFSAALLSLRMGQ